MSKMQRNKTMRPVQEDIDSTEEANNEIAASLYRHVKVMSDFKYDVEMRREDSLIQQSSHMQTAFSFMTAAVFMALPVVIENRGVLSLNFIFTGVSVVVGLLLCSLIFASLTQWRIKKKAPQNVGELEKFVSDHWKESLTDAQQLKQQVDEIKTVQESMASANDKRVVFIMISMGCFLASIVAVVVFYIVALRKMY